METLEIHSKDFLIKWINAPDNSVIDWEAKPLKKSINFSFYKKKEESLNQSEASLDSNSTAVLEPPIAPPQRTRSRSASTASVNQFSKPNDVYRSKSRASTLLSINESDLILIKNYYKLVANELVHGKFEVERGGMFAFVFDNSFSKTIAKSVQFSAKIVSKSKSEEHIAEEKVAEVHDQHLFDENDVAPGETLQSIMLKKRRKKLQGFTKRYFVLNYGRETLSYFKVDDNKLRGQMPIKDCIVSANPSTREFIIDSGMEVWHLKAINKADFNAWVNAFNTVKKEDTVVPTATTTEENDSKEPALASTPLGASTSELQLIAQKLVQLKTENPSPLANEIHQDFVNLLTRFKGGANLSSPGSADVQSVFSSDFHDAVDHFEETGVYFLDDEGKIQEDVEVADDAESSSEEDEEDDEFIQTTPSGVHEGHEVIQDKDLPQPTVEADDDNLYPLPHDPVSRPSDIPICTHTPPSILSFVRKNVGKDLSTIAMPVTYNEPTTMLQKFAEMLEYPEVATNALISDFQDESGEKLLRVAAFALSYLSTQRAKERNKRKPFTPLLGETYELVREDLGFRLISEKVSHRPPVFAYHVDTEHWTLDYALSPDQKFWGKQSEVTTKGIVYLRDKSTGEVFTWTQPTTMIKNIIAGETYAEPSGSVTIKSSNGYKAVAEFAKGGMWSGRSEGVVVKAFDNKKKELTYSVEGNWTESFTLKTKTTEKTIWQAGELLPQYQKKFGFTEFAGTLNKITEIEKGKLAPTDSRNRPDLQLYEKGDTDTAETLKNKLEQDQRDRRKELETAGEVHIPKFFKRKGNGPINESEWEFIQGEKSYWNRRKKGDWDDLIKLW
ncbi:oxysterol-binding protein, putative [Candida dubliniensis CD36]|uniref:Oxysterol-binding protein, putative n=1 Tax=Candida dubliniensis (strain CD36 / ATCC MYA-646 / CBS 7987 / NCPF 3949 / NRRL Y-17841) TaxID=573826 RepID=B9WG38_CANDC|nr:oxysterol-binding protein, putative [Candida dubliniensis CD36]CAX42208.1 oxysterol-binding protein, putative [Candida dubliniensis CD36]